MEEQPAINNQIQQPPINPVPASKKPNQWILAAIILVVIVVIAGIFILLLNSQKSTSTPPSSISPTSSPITEEVANWKTYTNTKYGYSLKYPSEMRLTEPGNETYLTLDPSQEKEQDFHHTLIVGISVLPNKERLSIDELIEKIQASTSAIQIKNKQDVTVGGVKGKKVIGSALGSDFTKIFIPYEDSFVVLTASIGIEKYQQYVQVFDQILSTFKFIPAWPAGGDQRYQVVCTQDAKLCPDGSYVSRQGSNCEFARCP